MHTVLVQSYVQFYKNMKKRGKRSRRGGGGGARATAFSVSPRNSGHIVFSGQCLLTPTLVSGANVIPLNPVFGAALGSILAALGAIYLEFRFKSLKMICHPATGTAARYSLSFSPGYDFAPNTTIAFNSQEPCSVIVGASTVQQTAIILNVPSKILLGEVAGKWFKCTNDASADDFDCYQGTINIVGTMDTVPTVELLYTIEFTSIDPSVETFALKDGKMRSGLSIPARRSIVARFPNIPIMDMYLPDNPCPYVEGRLVDDDFVRVMRLFKSANKTSPESEAKRLALLVQS